MGRQARQSRPDIGEAARCFTQRESRQHQTSLFVGRRVTHVGGEAG